MAVQQLELHSKQCWQSCGKACLTSGLQSEHVVPLWHTAFPSAVTAFSLPAQVSLLASGRLLYHGPCDKMVPWFQSVGYSYTGEDRTAMAGFQVLPWSS